MFPELRETKPDNETAAGMLARAVRHDLSSMARVRVSFGANVVEVVPTMRPFSITKQMPSFAQSVGMSV